MHKSMKADPHKKTHIATRGEGPVPDKAIARASRTHAATSLTAAADMAIRPTSVVKSLSSARIRAKTGKAVMERATPMNTRKGAWFTPVEMVALKTNEVPIPKANGRVIPARAMLSAVLPVLLREAGSISRPTRNRKKRRPRLAIVSRTVRLRAGKMVSRYLWLRPNADGPNRIPPCNQIQITHTYISSIKCY